MVNIKTSSSSLFAVPADFYVVPVFDEKNTIVKSGVNGKLPGRINELLKNGEINPGYRKKSIFSVNDGSNLKKIFFLGLGKQKEITDEKVRQAAGFALRELKSLGAENFATPAWFPGGARIKAQAEGFLLASYSYPGIKMKKEKQSLEKIIIASSLPAVKKAVADTFVACANVRLARDLMNYPANFATPSFIEKQARNIASKNKKIKIKVIDKSEAKKMGMGAFYAVAKGSEEPAKFIVLEYKGGKPKERPLAFVGKGITFDSGGISLKPSSSSAFKIEDMKYDMSGAAAVLYFLKTAGELKLKANIVAVIAATENLPSGKAYKPGDVIKTLSGITVEVISTDAEGRMVLSDAITYIKRYKPKVIVDLATLTGACVISLGHYATGLMTNDPDAADVMKEAGEETGERVWELPLWSEYREQIKSPFADIKNTGGPDAGSITAGLFLKEFAQDTPWIHLDIAGTAYGVRNKTYIPDGVSATGVRLLAEFTKLMIKKGGLR